jgi:hypothetical protein
MSQLPLPQTPEEVASSAMVLLGMRQLQSFSEIGRDEVIAASSLYEIMVAELSEAHRWKFCTGQQILEIDPSPPLDRYETAFHMPAFEQGTPFFIHTCRIAGTPQKYEIMADRVYCDVSSDSELVAEYSYRVAEAYWPPSFKMCAVFRLAAMLAVSVTRNSSQIKAMGDAYELQLARAKNRDAQSVTPKRVNQQRFLRNRIMPAPIY